MPFSQGQYFVAVLDLFSGDKKLITRLQILPGGFIASMRRWMINDFIIMCIHGGVPLMCNTPNQTKCTCPHKTHRIPSMSPQIRDGLLDGHL